MLSIKLIKPIKLICHLLKYSFDSWALSNLKALKILIKSTHWTWPDLPMFISNQKRRWKRRENLFCENSEKNKLSIWWRIMDSAWRNTSTGAYRWALQNINVSLYEFAISSITYHEIRTLHFYLLSLKKYPIEYKKLYHLYLMLPNEFIAHNWSWINNCIWTCEHNQVFHDHSWG